MWWGFLSPTWATFPSPCDTLRAYVMILVTSDDVLKAEQDANFARFTTHALLPIFSSGVLGTRVKPDTCGRANLIWLRIRVDVGTFESGKKKLWIQKYPDACGGGLKLVEEWRRPSLFPTKMTLVHARPLLGIEKFSYSLCLGFVNNLTGHVTAVRA